MSKLTPRSAPSNTAPASSSLSQQAFHDFMLSHWDKTAEPLPQPLPANSAHRRRRNQLAKQFPGYLLVIPSGHERTRANDTCFRFRPGSDLMYLTGCELPDAVLLLDVDGSGSAQTMLFVEPGTDKEDIRFFSDRHRGALWVGPQPSLEACQSRYGIEDVRALAELPQIIDKALGRDRKAAMVQGISAPVEQLVPRQAGDDRALMQAIGTLRLYKDKYEIANLQQACQVTRQAFDAVVRNLPQLTNERQVEVIFAGEARRLGHDVGYNVIAAAGAHACILHWHHNNGPLRPGDLLLLDAGVEIDSLYTADVTRTLPCSGKFTPAQRDVYAIVLAAQQAAIEAIAVGALFLAPHEAASRVLAQGLLDLGVCKGSLSELLDPALPKYKRYTLHGTSHMLGLDVHDCSHAPDALYRQGPLAPGHVFTVEPGLYFQPDDCTVPPALRGIGVRIEDDVYLSSQGLQVLSDVPKTIEDVEHWLAQGQAFAQQWFKTINS